MHLHGVTLFRSIAVLVLELAMAAPDLAFAWVLKCVAAGVLSQWEAGNPILSRAVVVFQHQLHQWPLLQLLLPPLLQRQPPAAPTANVQLTKAVRI